MSLWCGIRDKIKTIAHPAADISLWQEAIANLKLAADHGKLSPVTEWPAFLACISLGLVLALDRLTISMPRLVTHNFIKKN